MKPKILLCLALVLSLLPTQARPVPAWTDTELQQASDLVLVGQAIEVRDLDETNSLGFPGSPTFQPRFRGVETTFKVSDVLKGTPTNDQIVLHHYRQEIGWGVPPDGPTFISFTPGGTNEYVLHLKQDGTNRYAPAAGQSDPGLSIKPAPDRFRNPLRVGPGADAAMAKAQADAIVEQMRGFSMQRGQLVRSDGRINTNEQRKVEITRKLRLTGKEAVPALVKALKDPDVQMRRNAALVLIALAGAYEGERPRPEKVDIREAIPALVKATEDGDWEIRGWAAQALGEVGPDAKEAVPALLKLITDREEGCRNSSCIALRGIGPAARDALPALRNALNDPSKDVRQFAKRAIEQIEKK